MPKPLNQRIKNFIQVEIDRGNWAVGDQIPSESELARKFNASRMTVNRAVKELTERGLLNRVQGLGTYVSPFVAKAPLFDVRRVREDIESSGKQHSCTILQLGRVQIFAEEALRTGISPGEAYYLEAIHSADGQPLQFEKRLVNSTIAPEFIDQDFTNITASEYLLRHIPYTEVIHTVDAIAMDDLTAGQLEHAVGTPCLRLTRKTLSNENIITHVELIHPGNTFKLTGTFAGSSAVSQVA